MSAPAILADQVCVRHPRAERDAVRDVTLEVERGEILALVGPNGCGKSTLLASLAGGLAPRTGQVRLDGDDLYRLPARTRARRIARLPQQPAAPEGLTVQALVEMGRHAHRSRFGAPGRADRHAVSEALRAVDAEHLRARPIERISGGERRRVFIALALAQDAPVLVLDEPTAALDLRVQLEVIEHLIEINRQRGTTLVIALHELEQAARFAHRIAVLANGRLYEVGPPEKVLRAEMLCDVWGIEADVSRRDGWRIQVRGTADPLRRM